MKAAGNGYDIDTAANLNFMTSTGNGGNISRRRRVLCLCVTLSNVS